MLVTVRLSVCELQKLRPGGWVAGAHRQLHALGGGAVGQPQGSQQHFLRLARNAHGHLHAGVPQAQIVQQRSGWLAPRPSQLA